MKRLIVAALVVLFVVPATAHGAARLGFNDAWVSESKWDLAEAYTGGTVPQMYDEANASVIRIDWSWDRRFTNPQESTASFLHVVNAARAAGLEPLLTPMTRTTSADQPAYYNTLRYLTRTYPGVPIEILNEANSPHYGDGSGGYSPAEYATVLRKAIKTIRAIDPDHVILGAGAGPSCTFPDWLSQVAALTPNLDYILSVHLYMSACNGRTGWDAARSIIQRSRETDPGHDIWITEAGQRTTDDQVQAATLQGMANATASSGIDTFIIHRLYDNPVNVWDGGVSWGMHTAIDNGGTWRPALAAAQQGLADGWAAYQERLAAQRKRRAELRRERISDHCHARIRHHNHHHHKRTRRERFSRCFKRLNS